MTRGSALGSISSPPWSLVKLVINVDSDDHLMVCLASPPHFASNSDCWQWMPFVGMEKAKSSYLSLCRTGEWDKSASSACAEILEPDSVPTDVVHKALFGPHSPSESNLPRKIKDEVNRVFKHPGEQRLLLWGGPSEQLGAGSIKSPQSHLLPWELVDWQKTLDLGTTEPAPLLIRYTDVKRGEQTQAPPRTLREDNEVRPLILCCHKAIEKKDDVLQWVRNGLLQSGDIKKAIHIDNDSVLINPELSDVERELDAGDFNVVVYLGHVGLGIGIEKGKSTLEGIFQFKDSLQQNGEGGVQPKEFAEALRNHPRVQAVLLIACQTWPSTAEAFIQAEIPVVVGTHWTIHFDHANSGRWCQAVGAFLGSLAAAKPIHVAFAAMKQSLMESHYATGSILSASLAMHLRLAAVAAGTDALQPLRFLSSDPSTLEEIAYAKQVSRATVGVKLHDEVRKAGGSSNAGLAKAGRYIERTLIKQVAVLRDDRKNSEHYPSASERLTSSDAGKIEIRHDDQPTTDFLVRLLAYDISKPPHLGVQAPWGMGKTMLMRWIAHELAERFLLSPTQYEPLPFYVELWRLADALGDRETIDASTLSQAVAGTLFERPSNDDEHAGQESLIFNQLKRSKRIHLFDGLDEALQLTEMLLKCGAKGITKAVPSVISSRPEAVEAKGSKLPHFERPSSPDVVANFVDIKPLTPKDTQQLIGWLLEDKPDLANKVQEQRTANAASDPLDRILDVPYLVNLFCDLVRVDSNRALGMTTTTELLEHSLKHVITRKTSSAHNNAPYLTPAHAIPLAALAFEIRLSKSRAWAHRREGNGGGVDRLHALKVVKKTLERMEKTEELGDLTTLNREERLISATYHEVVLDDLLSYSGILRVRAIGKRIEVHDARFAEFLPAFHLARLIQGPRNPDDDADEHQGEYTARVNALVAREIYGWEKPCINDFIYNGDGVLVQRGQVESIQMFVRRKAWDELHWAIPLEFLAGLLEDPSPLLEELLYCGLPPKDSDGENEPLAD